MEKLDNYQEILKQFSLLPLSNRQPTLLEICKYPYNRFEEVCSRILAFFLNPQAEHGLHDLWLSALWNAIGKQESLPFYKNIDCRTEEYAEKKRIDIVVKSSDFAIAIENKITADIYNPLKVYKNHIDKAYKKVPSENRIMLVLSVFPISSDDKKDIFSKEHISLKNENSYKFITYKDLFTSVNEELGNYIANCNQKYLTLMLDFIKTIENMNSDENKRIHEFFLKNLDTINEMVGEFNKFNDDVLSEQKQNTAELLEKIKQETKVEWWVWEGYDLGISFHDEGNRIGIESYYETFEGDACGTFKIYITTWKEQCWDPYAKEIKKIFPEGKEENRNRRIYYYLYTIEGNNKEEIIKCLRVTYLKMKKITSEIK